MLFRSSLLGIRPLLTVINGLPVDIAKCRGMAQIKQKLIRKFLETAKNLQEVIVVHTDAPAFAAELAQDLRNTIKGICIHTQIGRAHV